ncbi:MAG: hypothetical protein QOD93_6011 [Acetobacteraceae bacterium]|jgi:hypothetical protein|nr:hypothetical protein [Acetobacteraceae bacterium]
MTPQFDFPPCNFSLPVKQGAVAYPVTGRQT